VRADEVRCSARSIDHALRFPLLRYGENAGGPGSNDVAFSLPPVEIGFDPGLRAFRISERTPRTDWEGVIYNSAVACIVHRTIIWLHSLWASAILFGIQFCRIRVTSAA
jgi:hypothetical protein